MGLASLADAPATVRPAPIQRSEPPAPDTTWNTVHTARALDQIRADGRPTAAADVARLSPLGFDHLRMLGRYNFSLPDDTRDGI
ncbi:Tn3 family transposase [Frankia sp. Cas3]|uniref:Tn3 family transposase n=1 Tax=Frankia sp. Cas3 TaxID=3073926 RepID=UPI002AD30E7F|nr:Tn3 family transposase [Frankia sp. Cas3]